MGKASKAKKDMKITKVCKKCGKEYHPTNNSYKELSIYCSVKCFRDSLKKNSFR